MKQATKTMLILLSALSFVLNGVVLAHPAPAGNIARAQERSPQLPTLPDLTGVTTAVTSVVDDGLALVTDTDGLLNSASSVGTTTTG